MTSRRLVAPACDDEMEDPRPGDLMTTVSLDPINFIGAVFSDHGEGNTLTGYQIRRMLPGDVYVLVAVGALDVPGRDRRVLVLGEGVFGWTWLGDLKRIS